MIYQVISLIPAWHNFNHGPNVVLVDADDPETALRTRLGYLSVNAYPNYAGSFIVVKGDRADMFAVSSFDGNHVIKRVEFGA